MLTVSLKPPSTVVTVTLATPSLMAATKPASLTVATLEASEDQTTASTEAFSGSTLAIKEIVSNSNNSNSVCSKLTPVTATAIGKTVSCAFTENPPSTVVTVIMVSPSLIAVTKPDSSTVATCVFSEDQITSDTLAFSGDTVADKVIISCSKSVICVRFKETPETAMGRTLIELAAVNPPSTVVTVMMVSPSPMAVTRPNSLTLATCGSSEDQMTSVLVAFSGKTIAFNNICSS